MQHLTHETDLLYTKGEIFPGQSKCTLNCPEGLKARN